MKARTAKGILLEEVVLYLLRRSGFRTITSPGTDPTLELGRAGLRVKGRGTSHQADALADFRVRMPFGHPTRLIVEAKCLTGDVGLNPLRNAAGVLKDVSEYYTGTGTGPNRARHHYRYAVASANGFSGPAQEFAFAHDIALFPMQRSVFMAPILQVLASIRDTDLVVGSGGELSARTLRLAFRDLLDARLVPTDATLHDAIAVKVRALAEATMRIGGAVLAYAGGGVPLLLIPHDPETIWMLLDERDAFVRFYFDDEGWYVRDARERPLFSFGLPMELFDMYASEGRLRPNHALELKQQELSELQAFVSDDDGVRLVTLRLDQDWFVSMREAMNRRR